MFLGRSFSGDMNFIAVGPLESNQAISLITKNSSSRIAFRFVYGLKLTKNEQQPSSLSESWLPVNKIEVLTKSEKTDALISN